jgi:hypothetical protein
MLSLFYKPLCVLLLLLSLFGLVWVRSSVVSVHYDIRTLEEKRMEAVKDTRLLLAERAKLMSITRVSSSLREQVRGNSEYAMADFVTPDRVKVVHIKKNRGPEPYKASLEIKK